MKLTFYHDEHIRTKMTARVDWSTRDKVDPNGAFSSSFVIQSAAASGSASSSSRSASSSFNLFPKSEPILQHVRDQLSELNSDNRNKRAADAQNNNCPTRRGSTRITYQCQTDAPGVDADVFVYQNRECPMPTNHELLWSQLFFLFLQYRSICLALSQEC